MSIQFSLDIIVIFDDTSGMKYPGGKGKTYHHIISLMPPHRVYIEAHLGGASVMRNKKKAELNFGIDKSDDVIKLNQDLISQDTKLIVSDALDFLTSYSFKGDELIYCDPPYLVSTRRQKKIYRHEYTDDDHIALLTFIGKVNASVIISGYKNEIYDKYLRDWNVKEFKFKTHISVVNEYLWYNFNEPLVLHDYRFIGGNFRERERIKRKRERIINNIISLPCSEMGAILELLIEKSHLNRQ